MNQVDFSQFHEFIGHAVNQLSLQQLGMLNKEIATYLRNTTKENIKNQVSPSGQAWQKRKKGNAKLFTRLKQNKHLKIRYYKTNLRVGWFGNTGRIARIHHHGLTENLEFGLAKYAKRELIGITSDDIVAIKEIIIEHLTKR